MSAVRSSRKRKPSRKTAESKKKPKPSLKWKDIILKLESMPEDSFVNYPISLFHGGKITLEVTEILFHKKSDADLKIVVAFRVHINNFFGQTISVSKIDDFFIALEHEGYSAAQDEMIESRLKVLLGGMKVCDCLALVDGEKKLPCKNCEMKNKLVGIISDQPQILGPFEQKICSACREEFTVRSKTLKLACNHFLHLDCATKLNQTKCPDCKAGFCHIMYENRTLHHISNVEEHQIDSHDL